MNHPNFSHFTEEEFLCLNSKWWLKFFTMLKQYDYDSRVPLGLFVDPANESLITLVRKSAISVYSYADISQYTSSANTDTVRTHLERNSVGVDDEQHASDLLELVRCVQKLGSSLKRLEYSNENGNEYAANVEVTEQVQLSNFLSVNNLTDSLLYNDKK